MECAQSGPPEPSVQALTLAAAHWSQRDVRAWLLASSLRLRGPHGTRLASETSLPPDATVLLQLNCFRLWTFPLIASPAWNTLPPAPPPWGEPHPQAPPQSLLPRLLCSVCSQAASCSPGFFFVVVLKGLFIYLFYLLFFGCAVWGLSLAAEHGLWSAQAQ